MKLRKPGSPLSTRRWRERSAAELSQLFVSDSHWRNLFGISWHFATFSGNAAVVSELLARSAEVRAGKFRIDTARLAPRRPWSAGATSWRRSSPSRPLAARAMAPSGCCAKLTAVRAWTISTSLDFDAVCAAREAAAAATSHVRDFAGPDWLEQRQASAIYDGRDPDVLIVGGGHAGISVAVEARRIGLTALVVDRMARDRRQLAAALSRAEAAQQDAGQSSALSAVPENLSGVHPEGQDRELAGELCRHHGGRLLDAHRVRGRRL